MANKGLRWVQVDCTFQPPGGWGFVIEDGSPNELLASRLDRRGIEDIRGKLVFVSSAGRFEIKCVFRSYRAYVVWVKTMGRFERVRKELRYRQFVTPGNFEAFNMLANKLRRRGIKNQPGKLMFEFVPA